MPIEDSRTRQDHGFSDVSEAVRLIAFYLPQFHVIPENDEWWGKGFTEWSNVRKALPLYPGHNQPRVPGELGYYDLTDASIRDRQADLAREHGIDGFCYWHYWFGNGRRILERPFNEVLQSGSPDFPFCLCWANQSWTGVWHGAPGRILMEQTYPGPEDDEAHFQTLLPAFRDNRYIKVDGKPFFAVYAPVELPDASDFVGRWRQMAERAGLPGIYLVGMSNKADQTGFAAFDRMMPYGPGDFLENHPLSPVERLVRRIAAHPRLNLMRGRLRYRLRAPLHYQYSEVVDYAVTNAPKDARSIPCVIPGWDNTPRSGRRGVVFENATAPLFERLLRHAVQVAAKAPATERFVFIKAWNEWAEGNMLEPTVDDGTSFLEATARVKAEVSGARLAKAHPLV